MRRLKMKKLVLLLLVLTVSLALVACGNPEANKSQGESDLSYVKDNGKLVIGYTDYAPMNYTDENGVFTGFDTELATLVSEKLGLEPHLLRSTGIPSKWNLMQSPLTVFGMV